MNHIPASFLNSCAGIVPAQREVQRQIKQLYNDSVDGGSAENDREKQLERHRFNVGSGIEHHIDHGNKRKSACQRAQKCAHDWGEGKSFELERQLHQEHHDECTDRLADEIDVRRAREKLADCAREKANDERLI